MSKIYSFFEKWSIYQASRFPLLKHGRPYTAGMTGAVRQDWTATKIKNLKEKRARSSCCSNKRGFF